MIIVPLRAGPVILADRMGTCGPLNLHLFIYGRIVIGVSTKVRSRNARGSGALLREEILMAATELLDGADSETELTLRGIACAAGITAPAIYAHFPDREAILAAVADRGWRDVVAEIRAQAALGATPRDRLHLGCAAYVDFAQRFPMRYALMTRTTAPTPAAREALDVVTRGLANCRGNPAESRSEDLPRFAAALSTALHGVAMLNRTDAPSMWLNDVTPAEVIRTLVDSSIDQQNTAEETA